MKHESLIQLAQEAEDSGCWASVANILRHEDEPMNPNERTAILETVQDLESLAEEAISYAENLLKMLR